MKKITYVKQEEVHEEGQLLKTVKYKPFWPFMWLLIAGIIMYIVSRFLIAFQFGMIVGIICIVYSGYVLLSVKDYVIAKIYDDGIVFYTGDNPPLVYRADYKDIFEWNVGKKEKNHLYMRLRDDFEINRKSFRWDKEAITILRKYLPNKETK